MYGMTYFWIASMYLSGLSIPSTGTSDPTPQKLNNPITFSLGGDLKRQGLSFSPFLIMTYRLCFPFTQKMIFITK